MFDMADDWLMLAAQLIFTLSCIFILVGVDAGMVRHNRALAQSLEIEALKWQALATATYVLNMMFIKLSIGFFLLRLAVQKRYIYIIWGTTFVVLIWSLALWFWDIFQCSPVQALWAYIIPNLKCVSAQEVVNAAYALSVMTIVTDWLFALLPIPMIWNVKMSAQAKATVVVILGLGIFASIATLVRMKFLSDLTETSDILFAGTEAMVWTLIEPGVAIVASSLVTIRPFLRKMRLNGFESADPSRDPQFTGRSGTGAPGSRGVNRSGMRGTVGNIPGYAADKVNLTDLEPGLGVSKGYWSQGTTLTSRTSIHASKPGWSGAVARTVQEGDKDVGRISPVANNAHMSGISTPDSDVFVVEGLSGLRQGRVSWASETSINPADLEKPQGLRHPRHRNGD